MRERPKIEAQLRNVRKNAGAMWWANYLQSHYAEINRRFELAQTVYWTKADKMPLDLFSYIREASICFTAARFLATIVLSSSAVELVMNRDRRTKHHPMLKRIGGWSTLNRHNLMIAAEKGLPVSALLSENETLENKEPISFVERRNKVAHGEISELIKDIVDYDPTAESEALDQLKKCDRFIVQWFNTAPDVQECHIRNYRWPET